MAGELWREIIQIGKETTAGTGVAATRIAYLNNVSLTRNRASRPHRFATGTRDNVRAHTQGPVEAGGSVTMPVSGSEILEWLDIGLQGNVTPTTPTGSPVTAKLWTFKPSLTINTMTIERNDAAKVQRGLGYRVNQYVFAGTVLGENNFTCELFGQDRDDTFTTLTAALTSRTPTFMEGWQTNVYIDTFGGTAGTTVKTGTAVEWNVTIGNANTRQFTAQNSLSANAVLVGELSVTASIKMIASSATAAAELINWDADTKRLVRLEFLGPVNGIETGFREFVTIDLPGAWTSPDTNQTDQGARAYTFPLTYVYDPTNAFGVQIRCQAGRATLY